MPLPTPMKELGLNEQAMNRQVVRRCKSTGIAITDDPTAPKLVLTAVTVEDRRYPDALAYVLFIDLVQETKSVQLDGTFMITTAIVPVFALRPTSELADTVRDGVILGMDRVLEAIRQISILEAD